MLKRSFVANGAVIDGTVENSIHWTVNLAIGRGADSEKLVLSSLGLRLQILVVSIGKRNYGQTCKS